MDLLIKWKLITKPRKIIILGNKLQIHEKMDNWLKINYEQGWYEFERSALKILQKRTLWYFLLNTVTMNTQNILL